MRLHGSHRRVDEVVVWDDARTKDLAGVTRGVILNLQRLLVGALSQMAAVALY